MFSSATRRSPWHAPDEKIRTRPHRTENEFVAVSHRPEQVSSLIRKTVQEMISRGLNDPRIRGLVSVTRVVVDPELAEARFSISVLPAEHGRLTVQGLQSAAGLIQKRLRESLSLRRVPRVIFVLDDSLKRQAETEASILRGTGGLPPDDPASLPPPPTTSDD